MVPVRSRQYENCFHIYVNALFKILRRRRSPKKDMVELVRPDPPLSDICLDPTYNTKNGMGGYLVVLFFFSF